MFTGPEQAVIDAARRTRGQEAYDFSSLAKAAGLPVGEAVTALVSLSQQRLFSIGLPWLMLDEDKLKEVAAPAAAQRRHSGIIDWFAN